MKNKEQGFTLVELIIVLIVIAVLGAISIPIGIDYWRNTSSITVINNMLATQIPRAIYACTADKTTDFGPCNKDELVRLGVANQTPYGNWGVSNNNKIFTVSITLTNASDASTTGNSIKQYLVNIGFQTNAVTYTNTTGSEAVAVGYKIR